jgi:hypothetical protein
MIYQSKNNFFINFEWKNRRDEDKLNEDKLNEDKLNEDKLNEDKLNEDKLNDNINWVNRSKFKFSDEVISTKWKNVFIKLLTKLKNKWNNTIQILILILVFR